MKAAAKWMIFTHVPVWVFVYAIPNYSGTLDMRQYCGIGLGIALATLLCAAACQESGRGGGVDDEF